MKTIKTQSNDLLIVEIPGEVINWQSLDIVLDWSKHKILGKLSELEDKDLNRFVMNWRVGGLYQNYKMESQYEEYMFKTPKESFISLLQSEGIDTNKNLLIIEVL